MTALLTFVKGRGYNGYSPSRGTPVPYLTIPGALGRIIAGNVTYDVDDDDNISIQRSFSRIVKLLSSPCFGE